jgi:hypothetical protein
MVVNAFVRTSFTPRDVFGYYVIKISTQTKNIWKDIGGTYQGTS